MVVFCCRRCTRLSLTRRRRRRRRRRRSRSRRQILLLYKRFRTLDKGKRGYLQSSDLTGSIPELSINPLNKRVAYFYDGINFKEFVRILAPYSPKASPNEMYEKRSTRPKTRLIVQRREQAFAGVGMITYYQYSQ